MQVQNVSRDAWPRFGTIIPSNLYNRIETKPSTLNPQIVQIYKNELIMSMADKFLAILQQQKYYGEKKKIKNTITLKFSVMNSELLLLFFFRFLPVIFLHLLYVHIKSFKNIWLYFWFIKIRSNQNMFCSYKVSDDSVNWVCWNKMLKWLERLRDGFSSFRNTEIVSGKEWHDLSCNLIRRLLRFRFLKRLLNYLFKHPNLQITNKPLQKKSNLFNTFDLTERLMSDHNPGTEMTKRPSDV